MAQVGSRMNNDLIGRSVGHYTLLERMSAGAMSTVYRAREADGQHRPVAIKILPVHLAANDTLHERFLREAHMASRLKHPHILPVYAFGEDHDVPYIAMKLVDGGTLADRIANGPLSLLVIVGILAQVADALDYAHTQGVIHRDIKPSNILFDTQGDAYLGDFGIARLGAGTETLTGTGTFIGTAAYASPEQCRGEEITPTSDIYSLGIVLYEMLTGVLPFTGTTPLALMHQHINEPVPNPLKQRPDLPIAITEVLRKALTKLPAVRYQTATAMSSAFNAVLRRTFGTGPLSEAVPPVGPNPVFTKPAGAYQPPSVPDELLRNLAPTRPTPPAGRQRLARYGHVAPGMPEPTLEDLGPLMSSARPATSQTADTVFWLLVILVAVLAVAVIAIVILTL